MTLLRVAASTLLASGLIAGSAVLPASAGDRGTIDYVALGDSYAAGVGAGPLGVCGQSPLGYPGLLDERKKIELVGNATCGTAQSLEVEQDPDVPDVSTQVAGLAAVGSLSDETDLVTLTVGGNDVDYLTVITGCAQAPVACDGFVHDAVLSARGNLSERLAVLFGNNPRIPGINDVATDAQVIVTGYPHLFSPEFGRTVEIVPGELVLTTAEQRILNTGTTALNDVIRAQAEAAGFTYVDVVKRFDKHGLGSPQPWIQPFTDPGALHPNAKGYKNGYLHEIRNALN